LFSELEGRLPDLPRKQAVLAQTLLEAPELVAFGSVRDLSAQLDVNTVTIIRFAKSLGFNGYQALQLAVRDAYLSRAGLRTVRAASDGEGANSARDTFAQHASNLDLARQHFFEADLDGIAQALLDADRIFVCASGSAAVPGLTLVRLLRHIGLRGELVAGSDVDRVISLHDMAPRDVLVVIGLWLTFRDTHRALVLARRADVRTIAIVDSAASPLGKLADDTIFAPAQGSPLAFSVVAAVAVVEALIAHVAGRRPQRRQEIERTLHNLYLEEDLLAPAYPLPTRGD